MNVYEKAAEYVRSTFAYSNASHEEMEAARHAYVAGYEEAEQRAEAESRAAAETADTTVTG
jgi:hypothetical protein